MNDYIKLTFVGDLMCLQEQSLASLHKYGGYNYDETFDSVSSLFSTSDYVVGNLETVIGGDKAGYTSSATVFNTPDSFLDSLQKAGFNFLSTANNHCLDRGVAGLGNTLDQLRARGFDTSGTYRTREESDQIFVKTIGGVKYAFLCFTYGTNADATNIYLDDKETWMVDLLKPQERATRVKASSNSISQRVKKHIPFPIKRLLRRLLPTAFLSFRFGRRYIVDNVSSLEIGNKDHEPYLQRLTQKIGNARHIADVVIVLCHMGGQYNPEPGPYTRHVMDLLVRSHVDIVIAGHSHTPHKCIWFPDGTFGAYSLGNFCFTPGVGWFVHNTLAEYGIVLNVFVDKTQKKISKVTFSVVKSIVGAHGYSKSVLVSDLLCSKMPAESRNMIIAENKAVVNRFRGTNGPVEVSLEYELSRYV